MKKFSKNDLIKKLGMSKEKADLVMKAQREFPELLTTEAKGFCIDSKNLWEQLGKPQGQYNKWYDRKIKSIFEDNIDYCIDWMKDKEIFSMDKNVQGLLDSKNLQQMTGAGYSQVFMLTLDTAKEISMMTNNEQGRLCRKYFIYLESAIKNMNDWIIIREPEKEGHKEMCSIIDKQYAKEHDGDKPNFYIYSTNSDMINLSLFGHKSKTMKQVLGIEYNNSLRDNLTSEANKSLYELQQLNSNLLISNVDFKTRKMIIENTCRERYMGLRVRVTSEFSNEIKKFDESK